LRSGVAKAVAIALIAIVPSCCLSLRARADIDYASGEDTVFTHSATAPYWLSGQLNSIFQWHPRFPADYSGTHSFEHASEQADSVVLTLYSGLELTPFTEALLDVESAGGSGLSQGLGLGGYTNIDVVRNPALDMTPYFARAEVHQVIPLGADRESADRTPTSLLTNLPARRIDLYLGRFALNDFFDTNPVASDSHTQFINWAVVNTAAYDYAADTRGYTWGGVLELTDDWWTFRFGEALLSKRPNGLILQKNLQNAHSENYELEIRREFLRDRLSVFHLLAFTNLANMGDYHSAITRFREGLTPTPEIDDHRQQVALKYGFAFNAAQEFPDNFRGFIRLGWNEGQHESWNYTEVDRTIALGGDLHGNWWGRPRDALGVALVSNSLSHSHREYLALGGLGFVLGDGRLSYGPERIVESYYDLPISRLPGWYGALDLQYIDNPGYNRARGPVTVLGARIHVEL
jgi:hypothetical protein